MLALLEEFDRAVSSPQPLKGAEPVEGMAYFVEQVPSGDRHRKSRNNPQGNQCIIDLVSIHYSERNGPSQITGSLVSSVRDACRNLAETLWKIGLKFAVFCTGIR